MSNKLTRLAQEILAVEDDLPFRLEWRRGEETRVDDYEFHIFPQTWGSTALGFGGMGGQAITEADTIVCVPVSTNQRCVVYFGGRYAYSADYNSTFREDLLSRNMASCAKAGKYITAE